MSAVSEGRERRRRFEKLEETITKWWPMHWPAIEACCAASATLYLRDVSQALALVLVARSGAGKGTILEQFRGAANTEWRDKFSKASLLSGYGEAKRKDLNERALFKVAKHKTLIIGDLNPLLKAGERDSLSQFYSDFAVWLDGGGLQYDTGTHGILGEKGDFTFVLLGGATPFRMQVWRSMAELGPRLLFYPVPGRNGVGPGPEEYAGAKRECAEATQEFLNWLANEYKRREAPWPTRSKAIGAAVDSKCKVIAAAQTLSAAGLGSLEEPIRPSASHLTQRVATISAGRAWLYGRNRLDLTDVAFVERIALASSPTSRGAVLLAMNDGDFEVSSIARRTGFTQQFVLQQLEALAKVGVVENCGELATGFAGRRPVVWKICPDPD